MTTQELQKLYWLNQEIAADRRRLDGLQAAATSTTSRLTGLPGASGIVDKTALAAEIADMRSLLQAKQTRCLNQYKTLMHFIDTVDDPLTRQAIQLRYENGLSWAQVAMGLGGGNSEAGVKKRVYRYLKKTCPPMSRHTVL